MGKVRTQNRAKRRVWQTERENAKYSLVKLIRKFNLDPEYRKAVMGIGDLLEAAPIGALWSADAEL